MTHAAHRWDHLQHDNEKLPLHTLADQKVLGFAGIGNPAAFEASLRKIVGQLGFFHAFPDHHDYPDADQAALQAIAHEHECSAIVTTDKDWVKLGPLLKSNPLTPPIYRPALALRSLDGESALEQLLQKVITTPS